MKKYSTLGVVGFPANVLLGLSEAQAAVRRHAISRVREGVFKTTAPVEFKRGEVLALDAPVKSVAALLKPLDAPKKAAA